MADTGLKAGFARVDISPKEPMPLFGYGNNDKRLHETVLDGICTTCVAFQDDVTTVLLFTNDFGQAFEKVMDEAREKITARTGVPRENIMLSSTHTHSGPDCSCEVIPYTAKYNEYATDGMAEAAEKALQDLAPAVMKGGTVETHGVNFVRHYTRVSGNITGDVFGDFLIDPETRELVKDRSAYADHTTEADRLMLLVKFDRMESEKKSILLANWRAHASITGGNYKKECSADFPHSFRKTVEEVLGCHVAYFQGASGNINPRSRIKEEDCTRDYMEFGRELAAFAIRGERTLKPLRIRPIRSFSENYTARVNHSEDAKVPEAKEVQKLWHELNELRPVQEFGFPRKIWSPYHADSIVQRSKMGKNIDIELHGVTIGDFAWTTVPCEQFDVNAKHIRDRLPFPVTFAMGYTNQDPGYIPSALAFAYGCYETHNCLFAPGTGEEVAEELIRKMKALWDED